MSGWVKIKAELSKSPGFLRLVRVLESGDGGTNFPAQRVMCAVMDLWAYAAENANADGVIECYEVEDLAFIGVDTAAILPTLEEIGWLKRVPGGVVFDAEASGLQHSVSSISRAGHTRREAPVAVCVSLLLVACNQEKKLDRSYNKQTTTIPTTKL